MSSSAHEPGPGQTLSLFEQRPWSAMLLNEGSFIRAYSIHACARLPIDPPSILPDLTGTVEALQARSRHYLPTTIRDVSYVGIFPFPGQIGHLTALLPHLQRLRLQLLPRADLLPDPAQRHTANTSDFESNVNTAYTLLMHRIIPRDMAPFLRFLDEVEFSDAAVYSRVREVITTNMPDSGGLWSFDERDGRLVRIRG